MEGEQRAGVGVGGLRGGLVEQVGSGGGTVGCLGCAGEREPGVDGVEGEVGCGAMELQRKVGQGVPLGLGGVGREFGVRSSARDESLCCAWEPFCQPSCRAGIGLQLRPVAALGCQFVQRAAVFEGSARVGERAAREREPPLEQFGLVALRCRRSGECRVDGGPVPGALRGLVDDGPSGFVEWLLRDDGAGGRERAHGVAELFKLDGGPLGQRRDGAVAGSSQEVRELRCELVLGGKTLERRTGPVGQRGECRGGLEAAEGCCGVAAREQGCCPLPEGPGEVAVAGVGREREQGICRSRTIRSGAGALEQERDDLLVQADRRSILRCRPCRLVLAAGRQPRGPLTLQPLPFGLRRGEVGGAIEQCGERLPASGAGRNLDRLRPPLGRHRRALRHGDEQRHGRLGPREALAEDDGGAEGEVILELLHRCRGGKPLDGAQGVCPALRPLEHRGVVLEKGEVERLLLQRLGQRVGGCGGGREAVGEQVGEFARDAGSLGALGRCGAQAAEGRHEACAVVALARHGFDAAPSKGGLFGVERERRVEQRQAERCSVGRGEEVKQARCEAYSLRPGRLEQLRSARHQRGGGGARLHHPAEEFDELGGIGLGLDADGRLFEGVQERGAKLGRGGDCRQLRRDLRTEACCAPSRYNIDPGLGRGDARTEDGCERGILFRF